MKRLGFRRLNRHISRQSIFANQKTIHIIAVLLSIIVIVLNANIKVKAQAQSVNSVVSDTIISKLVGGEFSQAEDDELIEQVFDHDATTTIAAQRYLDSGALENDAPMGIDASENDDYFGVVQEGSAIVNPGLASTEKTKRERTAIVYHTVEQGETISTIAQQYDISVNTILWENNLTAYSIIRPGDKLAILPFTGISYQAVSGDSIKKVASKFDVNAAEILSANHLESGASLKIGQRLMIPGGSRLSTVQPAQNTSSTRTAYSGISVLKKIVSGPGSKPVAGNMMNWPTVGHRITQYYSWRHTGLDIANKIGTPIYAADAGTVEFVGWGTGYGQQIVINHGGGKKTRYAHLSAYGVKKGQKVGKGDYIGAMGSTGWSTGPHLHFEVIINNVRYNPLNYIR